MPGNYQVRSLRDFTETNASEIRSLRTNPVQSPSICSEDVPPESENPGALAGATGADSFEHYTTDEYRDRARAATALCHAIRDCHPHDAAFVMQQVYPELAAGMPIAPLCSVMDQARLWAEMATPRELDAYALACTQQMAPDRRGAFLAYVMELAMARHEAAA